jgi:outer membrane protein OmpA-like peptidoglycan-associated protein
MVGELVWAVALQISALAADGGSNPAQGVEDSELPQEFVERLARERSVAFHHPEGGYEVAISTGSKTKFAVGDVVPCQVSFPPLPGSAIDVVVQVVEQYLDEEKANRAGGRTVLGDSFAIVDLAWPSSRVFAFRVGKTAQRYEIQVRTQRINDDSDKGTVRTAFAEVEKPAEDSVLFYRQVVDGYDFGSTATSPKGRRDIQTLVKSLSAPLASGKIDRIDVSGHACPKAVSEEANMRASQLRADAVAEILKMNMIPSSLIQVSAEGSRKPRLGAEPANSASPEQLLMPHRRVEIHVFKRQ